MDHYYALYEKLPNDGNRWITVIKGKKVMRNTLKRFADQTSNKITVLDAMSGLVVAKANR